MTELLKISMLFSMMALSLFGGMCLVVMAYEVFVEAKERMKHD